MSHSPISETAFLMAWSKAQDPILSMDPYAHLWLTEEGIVFSKDFSNNAQPLISHLLCLRGRYIVEQLLAFEKKHPRFTLINVGSGLTSYPFILSSGVTHYELDQPHVLAFRKQRVKENTARGLLPKRDIHFLPINLNSPQGVDQFRNLLSAITTPCYVLFEGIVTYLEKSLAMNYLNLCAQMIQHESDVLVHVFLEEDRDSRMMKVIADFIHQRLGTPKTQLSFYSEKDFCQIPGLQLQEHVDFNELEKRFLHRAPNWTKDQVSNEHFFVLNKVETCAGR